MIQVFTTDEDLNALAGAIDAARKNSVMVSVPRQALANLVCDAGTIFTELEKSNLLKRKEPA